MVQSSLMQKLPSNTLGRDFVIGDLHGCFDLLERLMKAVDFNFDKDRLFSVGDLVDRGPYSLSCLQLIEQQWFYAVKGNHEAMMLDYFGTYQRTGYIAPEFDESDEFGYIEYGGGWVEKYYQIGSATMSKDFERGLVLAASLPLLIVVGENEQRFHIVHSELLRPDFWSKKIQVWLDNDIDQWLYTQSIPENTKDRFYWGRTIMQGHLDQTPRVQAGLSSTFCGHTIDKNIRQKLSHVCLDTGAYLSYKKSAYSLTIYNIQAKRWVSASYCHGHLAYGDMAMGDCCSNK